LAVFAAKCDDYASQASKQLGRQVGEENSLDEAKKCPGKFK